MNNKLNIDFQEINKELENSRKIKFISNNYIGSHEKYNLKCLVCGNIWYATYNSVINVKQGCKKCGHKLQGKKIRLNIDFKEINLLLRNQRKLEFLEDRVYIGIRTKYKIRCLVCYSIEEMNFNSVVKYGHGCKKCANINRSVKNKGENSYNWKGGWSEKEYPKEWFVGDIQEFIRNRDSHKCQYPECNYIDLGEKRKLDVHHINEDKQNCNFWNLISLCQKHHTKMLKYGKKFESYFYDITKSYEL